MHVFVTGGTGLIGRGIVQRLVARGDRVTVLSRSANAASRLPQGTSVAVGDPTQDGPWIEAMAEADAVIHLAGEPIGDHSWTPAVKDRILASRRDGTRRVAEAMAKKPRRPDGLPRTLISTSAVGYYGTYEDNPTEFIEADGPGLGFQPDVCTAWERATEPASAAGVRVAIIRVGVVFARDGGALPKMVRPFRWFAGGVVGLGRQWLSWIHLDDIVGLYLHALDHADAVGPINGTAPEPLTNWGLSHLIAKVLRRPCWVPVPAWGVRRLFGEMAELVTHGQRVMPMRAKELGYAFRFALPEPALRDVLQRPDGRLSASSANLY